MDLSYFNTLPCEVQENVVRFLSKKPKSNQWMHSISSSDIETICELKQNLFTELQRNVKILTKTRSSYLGARKSCLFTNILAEFQSTISEVNIYSQSPFMRSSLLWVSVLENCSSLTSLSLSVRLDLETFHRLLSRTGKNLKSFSVRLFGSQGFIAAMTKYCTSLEKLELLDPHENCIPLWQSLNTSLKELNLQIWRSDPDTGNIPEVQKYCRSLISANVSLPWFCSTYEPIAELYASYGNQLQSANLSSMNESLCAYVASKCQNARFTISSLNDVLQRMRTLGKNLSAVEFSCSADTDIDDLKEISRCCPNIENLKYIETISITTSYLRALLCEPKPYLKHLDLRHGKGLDEETLKGLTICTGNLESFSCTVYFNSKIGFEGFAESNKRLQEIEIYLKPSRIDLGRSTVTATPVLHNINCSFKTNECLKEIKIQSTFPFKLDRIYGGVQISAFKNLFKPLISRGIYVEIFGVHYS